MEENKIENIGKINIADDVVASIAGIAAIEVDGVARLTGGISKEVVSKLGKKKLAKGVEVTIVDGNVEADVSVELEYGNNIAKVSKEVQNRWQKNLEEYLLKRENIKCLVQLIDGRHEIQKNDYQMREWVCAYNLPVITVVTKTDCISSHNKVAQALAHVKKEFGGKYGEHDIEIYDSPDLKIHLAVNHHNIVTVFYAKEKITKYGFEFKTLPGNKTEPFEDDKHEYDLEKEKDGWIISAFWFGADDTYALPLSAHYKLMTESGKIREVDISKDGLKAVKRFGELLIGASDLK